MSGCDRGCGWGCNSCGFCLATVVVVAVVVCLALVYPIVGLLYLSVVKTFGQIDICAFQSQQPSLRHQGMQRHSLETNP